MSNLSPDEWEERRAKATRDLIEGCSAALRKLTDAADRILSKVNARLLAEDAANLHHEEDDSQKTSHKSLP